MPVNGAANGPAGEPVLLHVDGAIATITLNRPERGNSIDMGLARGLLNAAIACDRDSAIRCVILTGSGKLFCGGGDLSAFAREGDGIPAFLGELAGTLNLAISRLLRMAKPLLVLVNGPAAGAGLSLALLGDVVLAAETAHFTAAYGSIGLSPDGGMSWMLPRLVGVRRAQDILLSNRRIGAGEAAAIGLVTRTVADLASEGRDEARRLAAAPTAALAATRALLLDSLHTPLEAQLEREARAIAKSAATQDCKDSLNAFAGRQGKSRAAS